MAPDLVLIEWVDSGQPIPGWQWLSDLGSRTPHKCVSVGFLIQDDETTKVLAPNLGASDGEGEWDQASGKGGDQKTKLFQFLNLIGARALRIQLGRVLEMAESSQDRQTYEAKIKERFGRQKEFEFMIAPPAPAANDPAVAPDDPFKPLH